MLRAFDALTIKLHTIFFNLFCAPALNTLDWCFDYSESWLINSFLFVMGYFVRAWLVFWVASFGPVLVYFHCRNLYNKSPVFSDDFLVRVDTTLRIRAERGDNWGLEKKHNWIKEGF